MLSEKLCVSFDVVARELKRSSAARQRGVKSRRAPPWRIFFPSAQEDAEFRHRRCSHHRKKEHFKINSTPSLTSFPLLEGEWF